MGQVTDPEILRQLNGGGAPSPASPPPFIGGVTTPRQAAAESRANEDQAMQREANARAAAAADRQAAAAERAAAAADRTAAKDAKGTESERTAGFLAGRIVDGIGRMSGAVQKDSTAASPTFGVEAVRSIAGDTAANYMTDPQRQQVRAAQMDILDAALTLGTGAAYTKEQLEGYRTSYFPQLGDDASTVASKQQALRSLIVNAQTKAGSASPDIEKALAALDAMSGAQQPNAKQEWTKEQSAAEWGPGVFDDQGNPLGPDGGEGFDAQGNSLGMFGSVTDDSPDAQIEKINAMEGDPSGLSGIAALAKQGVTLGLSDEAAGIGGAIGAFLTGQDPNAAYDLNNRAADVYLDRARQANPWIGGAAEFLGGGGAARVASMAPTIGNAMRTGATLGGTAGYGYGEGAGGSTVNALLGAAGGAAIGGASQYGLNALAARAKPQVAPDMEVIAAGQRQNIPVRQADARPELRGQFGAVEASPHGGPQIRQAIADDAAAIESRVAEVGGPGNASDPYAIGGKVQEAGKRYIAKTKEQANRLYDRARQEAGDATVTPRNADAALDQHIQELKAAGENSNGAAIKYLEGLRDDIDRGLSITSVQNLRSNMRGQLGERGLTGTDTERRVGQVIEAMNSDLAEQLPQGATTALKAADDFYRQRQSFINDTLKQFMGSRGAPLAAETAAARLTSMAQGKGNADRFASMWKQLDAGEQADVAATIAQSLGRKANGEFSVATLIKSLDPKQGINPRTARLIFGEDGAAALNDLRAIAQAKVAASTERNMSKTANAVGSKVSGLRSALFSVLGFSQAGVGGAVVAPMAESLFAKIGQERAARMLLNPDFTKWLKNAPQATNPKAIDRYFSKLGATGLAANDNQAFVKALREAFTQSPGRVAASTEQENNGRREPPKQ